MRSFARQLCVTALLLSSTTLAQAPAHAVCVDRTGTLDALVSANQTRSVERDLQQLRRLYHWDRAQHREVIETRGEEHWTGSGLVAVSSDALSGFPLCYSGGVEDSQLNSVWLTLMASVEDHRRELGLRLFIFAPQTKLASPRAGEEGYEGPPSYVSYNQVLFALEAQTTRYLSVMAGWLTPRTISVAPGVRGPAAEEGIKGQSLLQVGVPAANFYTSLILSPGSRKVETLYLDLRRLPIGETPFEVSARAGFLSNEERVFTSIGGSYAFPVYAKQWVPRIEAEAATEYGAFRLRQASLGGSASIPSIQFPSADLYGRFELYARMSLFNSAWLEQQAGASRVIGGEAGIRAGFGGDVAMLMLEPYLAVNRPETLALFSEGVGRFGWGMTAAFRITPWLF